MPYKDRETYLAYQRAYHYKDPIAQRRRNKKYKKTHPDKVKAQRMRQYQKHKEEKQEKARGRYWKNPEKRRAYMRKRVIEEPDKVKESGRRSREKHKEARKQRLKARRCTPEGRAKSLRQHTAWVKAHPEAERAIAQRRRARKLNAPVNDLTATQWEAIKEHYGHKCVYCGRKMQRLTQDHITPLSKGGSHTASNVVPACRSCNSQKHTGPPLCPVQPLLFAPTLKEAS